MKLTIHQPRDTARNILRSAGYSEYVDRNTHKLSYAKRLGADLFPKFHLYVEDALDSRLRGNDNTPAIILDLHIDQKQVSYEGSSMHSGEYTGPLIERELARIQSIANQIQPEPPKKSGFFASIFGGDE